MRARLERPTADRSGPLDVNVIESAGGVAKKSRAGRRSGLILPVHGVVVIAAGEPPGVPPTQVASCARAKPDQTVPTMADDANKTARNRRAARLRTLKFCTSNSHARHRQPARASEHSHVNGAAEI